MARPLIIVPGAGKSKVVLTDAGGAEIKNAWPPAIDKKALINDVKGALMKMMVFRKDGGFSDKIKNIVLDVVNPLSLNPDGKNKNSVKTVRFQKPVSECSEGEKNFIYRMADVKDLAKTVGEENVFYFSYNAFGGVFSEAKELDDFIKSALAKTNSDKADIITTDLGGALVKAYVLKYGSENLGKVVNVSSALDGMEIVGALFLDKLNLDRPSELLNYLGGKATSLSQALAVVPSDVMKATAQKAVNAVKESVVIYSSLMWALIPFRLFDDVFNKYSEKLSPSLREEIKEYHDFSLKFPEIIKDLDFYNISVWGKRLAPVVLDDDFSSDGLVEAASSSLCGSCSPADREPDKSTCPAPDKTYFVKDASHLSVLSDERVKTIISGIFS